MRKQINTDRSTFNQYVEAEYWKIDEIVASKTTARKAIAYGKVLVGGRRNPYFIEAEIHMLNYYAPARHY